MTELLNYANNNITEFKLLKCELSALYPFTINQVQVLKTKYSHLPIQELLNLISLQKKAISKFPYAEHWFFTDKNLQQASDFHLAKYHGVLFDKYDTVADLCCGIGSDLLYLSKNKSICYALDRDFEILQMAKFNMTYFNGLTGDKDIAPTRQSEIATTRDNIIYENNYAENFDKDCDAVFIDPDRRLNNVRKHSIYAITPNWESISHLIQRYKNAAVKLSPIFDHEDEMFIDFSFDFVSVNGELKECLLKAGDLNTKDIKELDCFASSQRHLDCFVPRKDSRKSAIILPQNIIFTEKNHPATSVTSIQDWLLEPDPAIIRSHLVNDLAHELCMNRIDEMIALLTSNIKPNSTYGKAYKVIDSFHYNLKTLGNYIKSKEIGVIDIKTKGFSEPVESFRKRLKLRGGNCSTLFIVRIGERHVCIFAEKDCSIASIL